MKRFNEEELPDSDDESDLDLVAPCGMILAFCVLRILVLML